MHLYNAHRSGFGIFGVTIVNEIAVMRRLTTAVKDFDFLGQPYPGRGLLPLHKDISYDVLSGIFNARLNEQHLAPFVLAGYEIPARGYAAIVFNTGSYLAHASLQERQQHAASINKFKPTHVLVAILNLG